MSLTIHLQVINLLAALLLLISFAMLSQRRIAGLITLFAWQGAALTASTALVAWSTGPASPVLLGRAHPGAQGDRHAVVSSSASLNSSTSTAMWNR